MIKKQKHIVFIGFLPGFGGAEKSMIMIANGLAKRGYNTTLISLKDNNVVYDIDKEVNYIYIPDHSRNKRLKQIYRFLELKNKLYEIQPDLVISFWLQPAFFAAILSKFMPFKIIYSERGDPNDKEYKGFLGIVRKVAFFLSDGFIFQTKGAQMCFPKPIRDSSTVINNPVYIGYGEYEIPQNRRKVIVNVGRLHEQKNQMILIKAFAKLVAIFPEYVLEIYGDGNMEGDLKEEIRRLGIENRVFLKGTTKKIFNEIVDASLFVLSSDYEGMPNALMEAMALGLPCISTDWEPGGVQELIDNKKMV